jgi:hypothetical protein
MPLPRIVYKRREDNGDSVDVLPSDSDQWPVLSDEALDVIAAALAELHAELRAEFTDALAQAVQKFEAALDKLRDEMEVREAVAEQRGQLKTMMSALGVEPIDMSDMIRKLRTRLQADIQELVDEAIAPLSERIAALKEEQMSLMPLEFHETVDKTVAALREQIATVEKQLSMLVSLLKGENVDESEGLKQIDAWPITLFEIDDQR